MPQSVNCWGMNSPRGVKVAVAVLFLLYPFLVFIGLKELQPRILAILLFIVLGLRFLLAADKSGTGATGVNRYALLAAVFMLAFTLITDSRLGLLLYPLLVNLLLFAFFFASLYQPMTIVEQIARRQEKDFPDSAIAYTRKVTIAWCLFFLGNGTLSLLTALHSEKWWMLYNGIISYLLIGLMMAIEFMVRRQVKGRAGD